MVKKGEVYKLEYQYRLAGDEDKYNYVTVLSVSSSGSTNSGFITRVKFTLTDPHPDVVDSEHVLDEESFNHYYTHVYDSVSDYIKENGPLTSQQDTYTNIEEDKAVDKTYLRLKDILETLDDAKSIPKQERDALLYNLCKKLIDEGRTELHVKA